MSSVKESAHRSVSNEDNSAHRSLGSAHRSETPSPWPHGLETTETISVPHSLLAPVIGEISTAWWELRRRYTMTVRGHRPGRERVMRFFTRRGLQRAHDAYLEAHRRVYRYWYSDVPIT